MSNIFKFIAIMLVNMIVVPIIAYSAFLLVSEFKEVGLFILFLFPCALASAAFVWGGKDND